MQPIGPGCTFGFFHHMFSLLLSLSHFAPAIMMRAFGICADILLCGLGQNHLHHVETVDHGCIRAEADSACERASATFASSMLARTLSLRDRAYSASSPAN
jgi:hypothetical protein